MQLSAENLFEWRKEAQRIADGGFPIAPKETGRKWGQRILALLDDREDLLKVITETPQGYKARRRVQRAIEDAQRGYHDADIDEEDLPEREAVVALTVVRDLLLEELGDIR